MRVCMQTCMLPCAISHLATFLQWQEDQAKEPSARQWLHFEVDAEGKEPLVILATQYMLKQAVQRGMGEPIYMDASHGMQRYGLKVATVHVKDVEGRGGFLHWLSLFCAQCTCVACLRQSCAKHATHVPAKCTPCLGVQGSPCSGPSCAPKASPHTSKSYATSSSTARK